MNSDLAHAEARVATLAEIELAHVARAAVFLAVLSLSWISVYPFQSMADPLLLEASESGDTLNQITYVAMAAATALALLLNGRPIVTSLARPAYVAMVLWLAIAVVTSTHPDLSARRFAFAMIVVFLAGSVLVLPTGIRQFTRLLIAMSVVVLGLCYAGVVLVPGEAVHQATDVIEPGLAGDWRGVFPHKNIAGAMMAILVFLGLFVASTYNRVVGWGIAVAAVVFLAMCSAKTATILLPFILILSAIGARLRSRTALLVLALGGLVLLNLATVGSVAWPAIKSALAAFLPDVTFTGRSEIWQFALEKIRERPLTGYGFMAFWRTEGVQFGSLEEVGPHMAAHAHNGFLDLALTTGLPGLALATLCVAVLPIVDYSRRGQGEPGDALGLLFLRIWLFTLYVACFESVLFDRGNPIWFCMLMAIFGLRFLSTRTVSL